MRTVATDAQTDRVATQPGVLAPEMAEDGDLAGRAESPGFGSADSPSPKCLQTAPRQCSPVPDSCRSGNSRSRGSFQRVWLLSKARLGAQARWFRSSTDPTARHGECRRFRAARPQETTLRLECRRGPTAEPNSPEGVTRGLPPGNGDKDTHSGAYYLRNCAACQVGVSLALSSAVLWVQDRVRNGIWCCSPEGGHDMPHGDRPRRWYSRQTFSSRITRD